MGESREEFERDRMGQTGEDNAKKFTSLVQLNVPRPPRQTGWCARCGQAVFDNEFKCGHLTYEPDV